MIRRRIVNGADALAVAEGWAAQTLERTLRRIILLAAACWQGVMLLAVATMPGSVAENLWLTVRDPGLGFDGSLPEGCGLARPVIGRREQTGLAVGRSLPLWWPGPRPPCVTD